MSSLSAVGPGAILDGKYRLERRIGEGGAGEVYAALNERGGDRVAIKVLKPEHAVDTKLIGRFIREARVAARIESDHVARVEGFGVCAQHAVPFIAYELLQGRDMRRVLTEQGPMPIATAVDYLMQALDAVAAAHIEGIVHRDLKPENLFHVERAGSAPFVKVLDFGVAKALRGLELGRGPQTSTTGLVGSPLYMAPEQLRSSRKSDRRADIWSLGVILYELLTGSVPFMGASLGHLLSLIMDGVFVPIEQHRQDVPPELARAIARCLDREPDARFRSVRELAVAIAPFGSSSSRELLEEIRERYTEETGQIEVENDSEREVSAWKSPPAFAATLAVGSTQVLPDPREAAMNRTVRMGPSFTPSFQKAPAPQLPSKEHRATSRSPVLAVLLVVVALLLLGTAGTIAFVFAR